MTVQTAQVLFLAIAGAMFVVWAVATRFAFSRLYPSRREGENYDPAAELDPELVRGEVELTGDRETLSRKIAERLAAATGIAGASFLRITSRTAERVAFERIPGATTERAGPAFVSGEVTLVPDGPRVRARYSLSLHRFARTMRLVTYLVCFVYGGLFVIGVPALVWLFVVHNEDERVRWQVFQTAQMIHGVWPPFLIGYLNDRLRRAAGAFLETLLSNLAHTC